MSASRRVRSWSRNSKNVETKHRKVQIKPFIYEFCNVKK